MISSYIKELRNKIGNNFLLLPSVTVLVFNEEGKILLVKHHHNKVWVAPGGMIEPDERPEDAAIREIQEEINCVVEITALMGAYGGPEFKITYENGDEVAYVMIVYKAIIKAGVPTPDGKEILDVGFFTFEETKHLPTGKWLPVVLNHIFNER